MDSSGFLPLFFFITGGLSALGKGVAASAIGALLKKSGLRVAIRKVDPYLNIDSGLMSPYQHGEVFVTQDGRETDLDLGHYERFLDCDLEGADAITSGRLYARLLHKERSGGFLGKTVQMIPHLTDEIQGFFGERLDGLDVVIYEIGGTVGDIEGAPFLEAARQWRQRVGRERTFFVHMVWIPWIEAAQEMKTKLAQNSVKELQKAGIQPDLLLCRCDRALSLETKEKLSLFCNMPVQNILEAQDVDSLFSVPIHYKQAGFMSLIEQHLHWKPHHVDLSDYQQIVDFTQKRLSLPCIDLALVVKYPGFRDAYRSLHEALEHAGRLKHINLRVHWLDSELFEGPQAQDLCHERLQQMHGVLVPGGFGSRGIEGKIQAIRYARTHKKPFFGICLGMHLMAVETARYSAVLLEAQSQEFDLETAHPLVIPLDPTQRFDMNASQDVFDLHRRPMRLGSLPCHILPESLMQKIYGADRIQERHRHLYQVNPRYRETLEQGGLHVSAFSEDWHVIEALEHTDHPWFIGVQFHPEFQSKPLRGAPLFLSFIESMIQQAHKTLRL